jgi:methyltransferase
MLMALAFVPMLFEAHRSSRNERALRAMGAHEPEGDVYALMQVAYPASFLAMIAESWVRGTLPDAIFAAGVAVFVTAKVLKYWAIATLGWRWTFRVLVPPRSSRILAGPYRLLRHPNYVAVIGELGGMALMAHAVVTGPLAMAGFGWLMWRRVRVEERALRM